jgi:hypothetical protein
LSRLPVFEFRHAPVEFFDYRDFVWIAGRGGYGMRFHADVTVENLAFNKQVGIVWTANNWQNAVTCMLGYEDALENGFEKWGGDCSTSLQEAGPQFASLAAFATMNGTNYWDNNAGANYVIGDSSLGPMYPSPAQGVTPYEIVYGAAAAHKPYPVAFGTAMVWPYPGDKSVGIVYTTDAWTTTNALAATANADGTWSWTLPLSHGGTTLTYAVHYTVAGVDFWANNGGKNYSDPIPQ